MLGRGEGKTQLGSLFAARENPKPLCSDRLHRKYHAWPKTVVWTPPRLATDILSSYTDGELATGDFFGSNLDKAEA